MNTKPLLYVVRAICYAENTYNSRIVGLTELINISKDSTVAKDLLITARQLSESLGYFALNLKIIIIEFTGKNMIGVNTPTNFEVEGFNFEYS